MRAALLLSLVVTLLPGCGTTSCTEIGCGDGDGEARFVFDYDAWADDQDVAYLFRLSWGGESHSCEGTVASGFTCTAKIEIVASEVGMGTEAYTRIDAVTINEFPGNVIVVVERDGAVVVEETFAVEEQVDYPNGPQCPPECRGWTGAVPRW